MHIPGLRTIQGYAEHLHGQEGIKVWSAILIRKDDALLRIWAVPAKVSVVFEGFILGEFDVKYELTHLRVSSCRDMRLDHASR